ncbi:MAG: methyltransferase domain-containing protein [bacterium]
MSNSIDQPYQCPHCGGKLTLESEQFHCVSCNDTVGLRRAEFDDFMLEVELDDDYEEFYEGEGTAGDEQGGPRISAQQFKMPNILKVLPEDFSPGRWLDMGCGGGWLMESLIEQWQPREAVGLDISAKRLQEALNRNPDAHFVRAPVEGVPYPDDRFDLVTALDVIEHIPEPEAILREAHRLAEHMVIKFPIEDTLFDRFQKEFWWPFKRSLKSLLSSGDSGEYFEPHLHRFHFDDARNLVKEHGFDIVRDHVSEDPFEDNHATMYPPAYNITENTPFLHKVDFHFKRTIIVGSMRITYVILPFWYYNIFNSGIYIYARRC